jgi:uncharacterized protein YdeI (YjbR/CyaY-like superfamily)
MELVVGFHKVASGRPSLKWPESVDEALCFGWIDGVRARIDEHTYRIRFTPRKAGSIWSAVNVAKIEALIAQGHVRPAGLAAYAKRSHRKTAVYSYEQRHEVEFSAAQVRRFRKNRQAWRYFEAAPPGYRKTVTHWVLGARQAATRERRLERLIEACAEGRRLLEWGSKPRPA